MARPLATAADWNAIRLRTGGPLELWSGYPAEIAPDLVLCPLLCGAASERAAKDVYTIVPRGFIVLHARDCDHLAMLRQDVLPRLRAHLPFAYLLDVSTGTVYPADHDTVTLRADELGGLITRIIAGLEGEERDYTPLANDLRQAFASLAGPAEIAEFLSEPTVVERKRGRAARFERRPIRLWEAMLWRGDHYRWELVNGEVPLVADLESELAANRTLVQCAADAERAFETRLEESGGWLVCGPLRLRQRASRVELRYRPSAADRRAAFAPRERFAGDDALPSLFGVLLAGGGSGKSELIDGFTDSVIEVHPHVDGAKLAAHLAAEVRRITGASAVVGDHDAPDPSAAPGEWRVRRWGRWVAVDLPMAGGDRVAWDALSGGGLADSFISWRWSRGRE